jgi:Fur family peroxide stress response transcriptional regulator
MKLFSDKFKEHNLKTTPQRVAIYKEIQRSKIHPTAEIVFREIKKTFPNISLDTVNRTLLTFARIGLITIVEGRGEPKRFDANKSNHHHFRCIKCNNIVDFYDQSYDRREIPKEITKRFTVMSKKMVLEGVCDQCNKKKEKK